MSVEIPVGAFQREKGLRVFLRLQEANHGRGSRRGGWLGDAGGKAHSDGRKTLGLGPRA